MNGIELFNLGRLLMKVGEEAIPMAGFHGLPSSVRSILIDVFEKPGSSVGEIAERTGFTQGHISSSVARLRGRGAFVTAVDPKDRRRTLVQPSPLALGLAQQVTTPIDGALAEALGTEDPQEVAEIVSALEALARRLARARIPGPVDDASEPGLAVAGRTALPGSLTTSGPMQAAEFDAFYAGSPPWDIGRPQAAFLALSERGAIRGRVLDVGCGTGEHALMAARLGLDATGIDFAATAIDIANAKARDRGHSAVFLIHNALDLGALEGQFDTVLDCGFFHVLDDEDRTRFVESLSGAVRPGGRYFMLCMSDLLPGDLGPRRVTQDEIRAAFGSGWRVDSIESAAIEVNLVPTGLPAWLASITRT
jgi:DNA-binding MarR family transcriptional regulator